MDHPGQHRIPPVSSTDDNIAFQPFDNGMQGFYSIMTGYKKKEIATLISMYLTRRKDTVTISFNLADLPYLTNVELIHAHH